MTQAAADYSEYLEIAPGVFWVGYADPNVGLHCNPYLIVDGGEAVLLDSGSRDDFSTVMLKILRTGVTPNRIQRLIYHHYDPDLCGNIPHMEAMIQNPDLRIISHYENNIFINYYSVRSPKLCIEQLHFSYRFASGRELKFIRTPYAHSPGTFMTYDTQTKVLFSSDLFGSYDHHWSLFTELGAQCEGCDGQRICQKTGKPCQLKGVVDFHERVMPNKRALDHALAEVEKLDVRLIAPQHGSVLHTPEARRMVIDRLRALPSVGIERFLGEAQP